MITSMKSKIMIPSLLLGVVMIAGAFAFMPVQEASTVHTTIQTNTDNQFRALTYTIEDGVTDIVLIPASTITTGISAGKVTALVTNMGSAGTCTLEDQGDNALSTAVGTGASVVFDVTGDSDWTANDAIRIDTTTGSTCVVTINIVSLS